MSDGRLFSYRDQPRLRREGGIETVRLAPDQMEGKQFTAGTTSFPPGQSVRLHTHDVVEQVVVLEGRGTAELNGERFSVEPYDATLIPPGSPHRFINDGEERMTILFIYGGTTVHRTWVESGETVVQFTPS